MLIRRLAVVFAIFLGLVILLVDLGYLRFILRIVSRVEYLDKVLHFLLIGTLTFLVTASLIQTFPTKNLNRIVLGSIFFFLIAFTLEEFSQLFIRRRSFSLLDLAANYAGILLFGCLAWWKYGRVKREGHS